MGATTGIEMHLFEICLLVRKIHILCVFRYADRIEFKCKLDVR
jgi:hypothetical protein